MAVKCWNCRKSDTTTGGGALLSCLNCGVVMDQNGDEPTAETGGEFPVTHTVDHELLTGETEIAAEEEADPMEVAS